MKNYLKKNQRLLLVAVLVFAMIFCLCSCNGGQSTNETEINVTLKAEYPVTVQNVEIKNLPQKAVSLSPAITEIIYSLGNNNQLCAVSDSCDYPDIPEAMPRVGSVLTLDTDKIIALQPDVLLCSSKLSDVDKLALDTAKIPIVTIEMPTDYDNLANTYKMVAQVLSGKSTGPKNAESTLNNITSALDAVKENYTLTEKKPKVLLSLDYADAYAYSGSVGGAVIDAIGAENAMGNASDFSFDDKQIVAANPDYIICKTGDEQKFLSNSDLESVSAVKNNRVYGVDIVPLERVGDRLALFAKSVCDKIYKPKAV